MSIYEDGDKQINEASPLPNNKKWRTEDSKVISNKIEALETNTSNIDNTSDADKPLSDAGVTKNDLQDVKIEALENTTETFTETPIYNGNNTQYKLQDAPITISPDSNSNNHGNNGELEQIIDGNDVDTISVSGVLVDPASDSLDKTKRNSIYHLFNKQLGTVEDNTRVIIKTREKPDSIRAPKIISFTVENDNRDQGILVFDLAPTAGDLTGMTLTDDLSAITLDSIISGSGTTTWIIQLSGNVGASLPGLLDVDNTNTVVNGLYPLAPIQIGVINNVGGIPNGALFIYDFENQDLTDSSGNNNDATVSSGSGAVFATDSESGTYSLDGNSATTDYQLDSGVAYTDVFTRSTLCKINSPATSNLGFFNNIGGTNSFENSIFYRSSDGVVRSFATGASGSLNSASAALPLDTWFLLTESKTQSTGVSTIYLNDSVLISGTITPSTSYTSIVGLCGDVNNGVKFDMKADWIAFWDRGLSALDVTNLYNELFGV